MLVVLYFKFIWYNFFQFKILLLDGFMDNDYGAAIFGVFAVLFYMLIFAYAIFLIFCWVRIYQKAGKPGWAYIVPVYNTLVELEILGRPWWWVFLIMFVPFVNIVIVIIMTFDLAKVFGKSVGFGFGLLFLSFIFTPMLAFGDAKYLGPIAENS